MRHVLAVFLAVVLPVLALASDPVLLGEFGFGTALRAFLWTGMALGIVVYLAGDKLSVACPCRGVIAAGVLAAVALALTVAGAPLALLGLYSGYLVPPMLAWVLAGSVREPAELATFVIPLFLFAPLLAAPFYWRATTGSWRASRQEVGTNLSRLVAAGAFCATLGLPTGAYWLGSLQQDHVVIGQADAGLTQRFATTGTLAPTRDESVAAAAAGYSGRGNTFRLSPDGRILAFIRSESDTPIFPFMIGGDHHVYVWDVATRSARKILAVREIDPGSGSSFTIAWTGDGSSLHLTGAGMIDGYGESSLDLYYVLDQGRWLEAPPEPLPDVQPRNHEPIAAPTPTADSA